MSKTDITSWPVYRKKSLGQFHDQVTVAIFNKEDYRLHQFNHLFTVAITNQVGMSTVSFKLKSLWPYTKVGYSQCYFEVLFFVAISKIGFVLSEFHGSVTAAICDNFG